MSNTKLTEIYEYYQENKEAKKVRRKHLSKRTYAFIIDLYAIVFANKALSFIWLSFVNHFISNVSVSNSFSTYTLQANTTKLSLPIMFFSYFFFSYFLGHGQTLGKAIMKLKVVNTDNMTEHLTLSECFMRSIGYIGASFLFYLPFAFNYLRRDQKGMQDFMSGTEVISIDDFAFALAQAEAIPVESAEQISLFEDVA